MHNSLILKLRFLEDILGEVWNYCSLI
jgi:hypothetical protein